MKSRLLALFVVVCPLALLGQSSQKPALPPHSSAPVSDQIETERIGPSGQSPVVPAAQQGKTGYLEPTQLKVLTHRIWLAQYRLNDLISQVHPETWKMDPGARQSFGQSLDSLRKSIAAEEDWRSQLDGRPDSLYLGFQMYMAISAVLPRIDGLARSISKYENASFGGQFSQAGNQLFDLQQVIEPHLAYLLKNQDNAIVIVQTNLASCQNELSFAEHDKEGRAIPMKNIVPEFKGRRRNTHTPVVESAKGAESKGTAAGKRSTNQPPKGQKN